MNHDGAGVGLAYRWVVEQLVLANQGGVDAAVCHGAVGAGPSLEGAGDGAQVRIQASGVQATLRLRVVLCVYGSSEERKAVSRDRVLIAGRMWSTTLWGCRIPGPLPCTG